MNTQEKIDYIIEWLKSQLKLSGMKGFVVGVSGGIDSAVVSTLCAKTGMPTLIVNIPITGTDWNLHNTPSFDRAAQHISNLYNSYSNVEPCLIDLSLTYFHFFNQFGKENKTEMALVNSKARLRMTTLYQLSAARGYLVVGTGNKVEDFGIGFFSKYGDGGVDISPIADLYKSEVYELARELEVNENILNAIPTDDLWDDGRSDEEQIGATYDELENTMKKLQLSRDSGENVWSDREKEVMEIYSKHRNNNMHKMLPIPVCKFPKENK